MLHAFKTNFKTEKKKLKNHDFQFLKIIHYIERTNQVETPARPPPGRQVRLIVGAMWTFAPLDSSHITEHYERDGVLVDFGWKTVRARARVRNSTDNRDLRRTAAKFAGANIISIAVYRGSRVSAGR